MMIVYHAQNMRKILRLILCIYWSSTITPTLGLPSIVLNPLLLLHEGYRQALGVLTQLYRNYVYWNIFQWLYTFQVKRSTHKCKCMKGFKSTGDSDSAKKESTEAYCLFQSSH